MVKQIFKLSFLTAVLGLLVLNTSAFSADKIEIQVYSSPACGCCGNWVKYLEKSGFKVKINNTDDMDYIKKRYKITPDMQSCHTGVIGGYVLEGHVPVEAIHKLLEEKPAIRGVAVPGMPMGSPGMAGGTPEAYVVYALPDNTEPTEFLRIEPSS